MNFDDYQKKVKETAIYPNQGSNVSYAVLGLTGEAGEVADKVKKLIRDDGGIMSETKRAEIIKELGDVLWYLTAIGNELNVSLEEIARKNTKKLADRKKRGVLSGDGDNR